jgi:hypothetical protein
MKIALAMLLLTVLILAPSRLTLAEDGAPLPACGMRNCK